MNEYDLQEQLTGADKVRQWFGSWPNFHDAEVISLSLARQDQSILRVYPYYPHKPATVDFIFENVTDVELQDFSAQNVISSLKIEIATDQNGDKVFRIVLGPCYGLAGKIDARSLRVARQKSGWRKSMVTPCLAASFFRSVT